jgi:hypothetical protein
VGLHAADPVGVRRLNGVHQLLQSAQEQQSSVGENKKCPLLVMPFYLYLLPECQHVGFNN